MRLFMITDHQGNTLADNLREPYALSIAISMAKELQQTVTLYDRSAASSENGIEVSPHASDVTRERKVPIDKPPSWAF